jgi:predicted amidophosphoribosyltransferase
MFHLFILHGLNIQFSVILIRTVKKIMRLQTTFINYRRTRFRHYYLCHYLPLSAGKDVISRSLLKFKRRTRPDFNTWIGSALEALQEIPPSPDTVILRALHHDETSPATIFPTALDFLGHAIADRFGCRYTPSLLRKSRPTQPCKELSRLRRKAELQGIYSIDPNARQMIATPAAATEALAKAGPTPPDLDPSLVPPPTENPNPPFLLIDDILTTGTTMRMIIQPLRPTFPLSLIHIFTLARADYDPKPHPAAH